MNYRTKRNDRYIVKSGYQVAPRCRNIIEDCEDDWFAYIFCKDDAHSVCKRLNEQEQEIVHLQKEVQESTIQELKSLQKWFTSQNFSNRVTLALVNEIDKRIKNLQSKTV